MYMMLTVGTYQRVHCSSGIMLPFAAVLPVVTVTSVLLGKHGCILVLTACTVRPDERCWVGEVPKHGISLLECHTCCVLANLCALIAHNKLWCEAQDTHSTSMICKPQEVLPLWPVGLSHSTQN